MSDPPWLESLLNGYPCPSGSEWCGKSHTYKDTLETPPCGPRRLEGMSEIPVGLQGQSESQRDGRVS